MAANVAMLHAEFTEPVQCFSVRPADTGLACEAAGGDGSVSNSTQLFHLFHWL